MKWMHSFQIATCGVAASLLLTACGSELKIVPADTIASMKDQITFTDQFETLDKEGACRVYGVDEELVEDSAALAGSGATAESLSVWQAVDASSAEKVEEQLQVFVDGYIEGYSDYKPEEVPKLESAIMSREGQYVILCISADNAAAEDVVNKTLHP
ncbi:DUF4358 domain-containing protein [Intestinibacillus sp. Marseille-P6563]|uniref:DUF4358 domain-containing protein n=1 Tax=Intestinibacillus sp. Marseille-P6563 TaxID=2364792 RepID=UPI0013DF3B2D|nr:DUF4358 domain-containing protein [Intestinibacillus sp. Marseille-P6563]